MEILDARPLGGAWTLDRLWERLGIGAAIRRVAAGRRLDGEAVERVVFALVAQRALKPGSKLAATDWVAKRVAIEGLMGFTDDQAYRAMDFLLDALEEIAGEIFGSVAHLLNLDLDIIFVDTTSTYFELDVADELADLQDTVDDDGVSRPVENGARAFGHSKDFRTDLPQVVIAMAVTSDGVPVRCWTFPGNTADTSIIRTVKDDLAGWNLHRMVWVADRGFASAANRAYLTRGGGHYIHAEKLRNTNSEAAAALARPGRAAPSRGTCGSKKSPSPPAATATGMTARGRSGSWSATTPNRPTATGRPRPPRRTPRAADGRLRWLDRPAPRRTRRLAQDQARAAPLPAPHQQRAAARRRGRDQTRAAPGRQVAAPHLRQHADPRRPAWPRPTRRCCKSNGAGAT